MNTLKHILHIISLGWLFPISGAKTDVHDNSAYDSAYHPPQELQFIHELPLTPLSNRLNRVVSNEAVQLGRSYDPDKGLDPLGRSLAQKFAHQFNEWERDECQVLGDTAALLRNENLNYSADQMTVDFNIKLTDLGTTLKENIKAAFFSREVNKSRLKNLRMDRNELEKELWAIKIALTGDENRIVHGSDSQQMKALAFSAYVVLIGIAEYMLGFGTFKYESDTLTAIALSITVVFVFTVMAYLGGTGASKIIASRDANRRFHTNYPTRESWPDFKGRPIVPHKASLLAWVQFLTGTGLLLAASAILFVGRFNIIQTMSEDGSMYMAGAIALIFLSFVTIVFKAIYGAKYDSSDVANYIAKQKRLSDVEAKLEALGPDAHLGQLNEAFEIYESGIEELRKDYAEQVSYITRLKASYLSLYRHYSEAYESLEKAYDNALEIMGKAISKDNADVNPELIIEFINADKRIEQLEAAVPLTYKDDEFLGIINDWTPESPNLDGSDIVIKDYQPIIEQSERLAIEEFQKSIPPSDDNIAVHRS